MDLYIEQVYQQVTTSADTTKKKSAKEPVHIQYWADEGLKRATFEYKVLIGNVKFLHDGAYLYCDSAYYDEVKNAFEAFSNVRMEQGDTIFLYGDYMHYDGNTKLIKVRDAVKLENVPQDVTLFTDSLNYDRVKNMGYYFNGGILVDSLNELKSYWGQYEPDIKQAFFTDSVVLTNPNFTLYSDTLQYNTGTRIATILSKSRIESDSGTIYTSRGWHNTQTQESLLLNQSLVVNKAGNQTLQGDSIFYDRAKAYGEVFGNMQLVDTTKKVILRGNYGYYNEAANYSMAADSAYCIDYSQGDSLFIHADTLKLITITNIADSIHASDSLVKVDIDTLHPLVVDSLKTGEISEKDSTKNEVARIIKAYYGVRFYRSDIQGVCDSMQYNSVESKLYLYDNPVLWNENRQLSGDSIIVFMNDSTVDQLDVRGYSFSIEQVDSLAFNQIKGRSMTTFFEEGKVRTVLVEGNVETIFYPEEKDKTMIGLNWLESSYMKITLKDGQLERLITWPKSKGKITPIPLVLSEQRQLTNFYWYDYLKPMNKDDIFRKVSKKVTDIAPKHSAIFNREEDTVLPQ